MKRRLFSLVLGVFITAGIIQPATAQQSTTITGVVYDAATDQPLPGVNIQLVGRSSGTVSDRNGQFQLSAPEGAVELRFSYIGYKEVMRSFTLAANEKRSVKVRLETTYLSGSEVVVTGSRGGGRSTLESAVPVDVISVDELDIASPQVDLNQLLTYVAPSFQSNRQSSADESEHIAPASLRGMGPDQVLVLVNGKRRHTSSLVNLVGEARGTVGTDLSVIPTAAIDRIEVLRDGAAAQYGSDAIAGVINIILKDQTGTLTASALGGAYTEGDGETTKFDANYGFSVGETGFVNITGWFTNRESTNRTGEHSLHIFTPGFAYPLDDNPAQDRAEDNAAIAANGYTRDDFDFQIGDAAMQIAGTFVNAVIPVNQTGTEFYAFGGLSNKQGTGFPFRRLPIDEGNVPAVYPAGFQPNTESSITDRSLTLGLRGNWNGWDVDFSNSYGSNGFDFRLSNSINASRGVQSPTDFDVGGFFFSQNVTGLTLSRFFDEALADINVAAGSEFRIDSYRIEAGEEASYRNYGITDRVENGVIVGQVDTLSRPGGSQGYPGFRPTDASETDRTNIAAFIDVEVNISPQLLLTAASRFERYSDFGNTLTGKLSGRYVFNDAFVVRGAVSTGFRAPSLHQVSYSKITSDFNNNRIVQIGTFNNDSRAAELLGIPNLTEETSVSYSAGFTLRPLPNLSITADAYQINVDDRIILTSSFDVAELPDDLRPQFEQLGIQAANFFTNAIDTRTRGVDVVATYNQPVSPASTLQLSVAGNINRVDIQGDIDASPQLQNQTDSYLQPWDRLALERGSPQSKVTASAIYEWKRFSALLRGVRFGEVQLNTGGAFGVPQTYDSRITTDLSLSYEVVDGATFTAGANNIFDVYPEEHQDPNSYYGVFRYPPIQQGFNGAYYFGKISINY